MALLRMKEIREMTPEALAAKLKQLRDDLLHERGVGAMGGAPHSPGKIRALRTNLARLLLVTGQQRSSKTKAAPPEPGPLKPGGKEE